MKSALDKKPGFNWLLIALIGISAAIHAALLIALADMYHPKAAPAVGIEVAAIVSPATGNGASHAGIRQSSRPVHPKSVHKPNSDRVVHHRTKPVHHKTRPTPRPRKPLKLKKVHPTVAGKRVKPAEPVVPRDIKPIHKAISRHAVKTNVPAIATTQTHATKSETNPAIKSAGNAEPSSVAENKGSAGSSPAGARSHKNAKAGIGTRSGVAGAVTASAGSAKIRESYYDTIRRMIEQNKHYPLAASMRRLEGRVLLAFIVNSRGRVSDIRVIRSSRFSMLDNAAIAAVRKASPFPPPPKSLFNGPVKLTIPIAFEIR